MLQFKNNFSIANYTFLGLITSVVLCFYGNFELRIYLAWFLSFSIIFVSCLFVATRLKIKKLAINVFLISSMWLFLPIILSSNAFNLEIHIKAILETLMYILFFINLCSCIDGQRNKFFGILRIVILVTAFFSILSLFNYFFLSKFFTLPGLHSETYSGFHSNPNTYSVVLLTLLVNILIFHTKIFNSKRQLSSIVILFGFQILLTGSSKGFIGLAIIFLLIVIFKTKSTKKLFSFLLLILISLFILTFADKSVNRLTDKIYAVSGFNKFSYDETDIGHDSGKIRLFLMLDSFRIIKDNFWIGVGVNNGQYYITLPTSFRSSMDSINSQNNITEMLLNGGVFAFLLYYGPILSFLILSLMRKDKNNFDHAIIILSILKIFLDTGMKSYNDASHVMIVIIVYFFHYISWRKVSEN